MTRRARRANGAGDPPEESAPHQLAGGARLSPLFRRAFLARRDLMRPHHQIAVGVDLACEPGNDQHGGRLVVDQGRARSADGRARDDPSRRPGFRPAPNTPRTDSGASRAARSRCRSPLPCRGHPQRPRGAVTLRRKVRNSAGPPRHRVDVHLLVFRVEILQQDLRVLLVQRTLRANRSRPRGTGRHSASPRSTDMTGRLRDADAGEILLRLARMSA